MKSLNLKKFKTAFMGVATAVVMGLGVIAPTALAVTDVGDGVNEFVNLINENPEQTSVIIGSVADVTDAITAADFVDALRETSATTEMKSVEVPCKFEFGENEYPLFLEADTDNPHYTSEETEEKTLTPTSFKVLKELDTDLKIDGDSEKLYYQEEIVLPEMSSVYDEDKNGHGTFLKADEFKFRLNFKEGFPADANYDKEPKIELFEQDLIVDTLDLANREFNVYSGKEYYMEAGEELDGIKVKSVSDGEATFEYKGEIASILKGTKDELAGKTIYVMEANEAWTGKTTGIVKFMFGGERIEIAENEPFALDEDYEVSEVKFEDDKLMYVEFAKDMDAKGTVKYGLEKGTVIDGLMKKYTIEYQGFGSITPIDTTDISLTAIGDDEGTFQATWTDVDGKFNELLPRDVNEVAMDGNFEKGDYGVFAGHAIKFLKLSKNDAGNYRAIFEVAGKELGTNYVELGENATLSYQTINGEFDATVNLNENKKEVEVFDMDWEFEVGGPNMDLFNPTLNLANITDAVPFTTFTDENEGFAVVYVNNTDDDGIKVINQNEDVLINTAQDKVEEDDEYDITGFGNELEADGNELTITIPEAPRDSKLVIRENIEEKVCKEDQEQEVTYNIAKPVIDNSDALYQVVVGGPWVNVVAQGISGNELTTVAAGTGYLIRDGNKLLVAGMDAADTTDAMNTLIELLKYEPEVE